MAEIAEAVVVTGITTMANVLATAMETAVVATTAMIIAIETVTAVAMVITIATITALKLLTTAIATNSISAASPQPGIDECSSGLFAKSNCVAKGGHHIHTGFTGIILCIIIVLTFKCLIPRQHVHVGPTYAKYVGTEFTWA